MNAPPPPLLRLVYLLGMIIMYVAVKGCTVNFRLQL